MDADAIVQTERTLVVTVGQTCGELGYPPQHVAFQQRVCPTSARSG